MFKIDIKQIVSNGYQIFYSAGGTDEIFGLYGDTAKIAGFKIEKIFESTETDKQTGLYLSQS